MFAIIVDFIVHPGKGEEVSDAFQTRARNSLEKESRYRQFDLCGDPDDLHICLLYKFMISAVIDAHGHTEHYAALCGRRG